VLHYLFHDHPAFVMSFVVLTVNIIELTLLIWVLRTLGFFAYAKRSKWMQQPRAGWTYHPEAASRANLD
jgi:hypothetical protein